MRRPRLIYVGAQLVLTVYAPRVAGMAQEALVATLLLVPALAAGVAFGVLLVMPERRKRRHRRRRNGSRSRAKSTAPSVSRPRPNGSSNGRSNGNGAGHV
jgi:hypothetical protein